MDMPGGYGHIRPICQDTAGEAWVWSRPADSAFQAAFRHYLPRFHLKERVLKLTRKVFIKLLGLFVLLLVFHTAVMEFVLQAVHGKPLSERHFRVWAGKLFCPG